jgi:nucleoside-diphosphate-sugar epimerase
MKVLVTGLGLLGVQLVKTLAGRGYDVIAFDIRSRDVDFMSSIWNDRVRFVQGDITDANQLNNLANDNGIDAIVHTAVLMNEPISRTDPVRSFCINVEGTLNVLEIVRARGIRCVCMSSQSAYGSRPNLDTIPSEDIVPYLGSLYASEKVMCETLLYSYRRVYGADAVIFRPNQMYGPAPTQYRTVMDQMIRKAMQGEPISSPSGAEYPLAWTYAPDMAEAITRALEKSKLENWIFNVEEGRLRTIKELAQIIAGLIPGTVVDIGPGDSSMPGFSLPPKRGMGDTKPMREELKMVSTPLEEGVRTYVDWLRINPVSLTTI